MSLKGESLMSRSRFSWKWNRNRMQWVWAVMIVNGATNAVVRAGGEACCLPGGDCLETNSEDCLSQGGAPRGGVCGETLCGGACCFPDTKDCMFTGPSVCNGLAGNYLGDGSDCSSCPAAMPTAITYQGQLRQGGAPLTGPIDLEFSLWSHAAGGEQIGGTIHYLNVPMSNGLFAVELDFGVAAFNSNARWIEVAVCESAEAECTTLSPRQSVTPTPYALQTRGMYVDEFNNVGFGTKSPSDRLSVVDGMTLDAFDWNAGALANGALKFGAYSGEGIASQRIPGENQWGLDFYTNGFAAMSITSNRFVGIGTRAPYDPLTVVGGITLDVRDENWGVVEPGALRFGYRSGEGIASNRDATGENAYGLDIFTNFQPRMSIDNFGNVGIGTLRPQTRLTVEAPSYGIEHRDGIVSLATYLDAQGGWFGTTSNHPLQLYVNNGLTAGLTVDTANNVGIGTMTPAARLHVLGEAEEFAGVVQAVQSGGSSFGAALLAATQLTDGTGLIAEANGDNAYAIWGRTDTGFAGVFDGNVDIAGTLSKSAGSFKIDHPLDPENKYLSHSFVESPDMMNVYNGNAVLNGRGEAWIELPTYFEALNSDYRYQLTALGAPGPNLHVAEEIRGNRFKIAGGSAGQKVSWQVTGIRQDAYARQNRIPVEQEKSAADKGRYRVPEVFGKSKDQSVHRRTDAPLPSRTGPATKN